MPASAQASTRGSSSRAAMLYRFCTHTMSVTACARATWSRLTLENTEMPDEALGAQGQERLQCGFERGLDVSAVAHPEVDHVEPVHAERAQVRLDAAAQRCRGRAARPLGQPVSFIVP
jgi:hypothetical protein